MPQQIVCKIQETSKANSEFGACDFVRTETITHDVGRVDGRVVGTRDGRFVDEKYTRFIDPPKDLEVVRVARLSAGWSVL